MFALRKVLQTLCLLGLMLLFSTMSLASVHWQSQSYSHFSNNEPVVSLLEDFSASVGVPLVMSESLSSAELAVFNGELSGSALRVLEKISRLYNLSWYFDNHMLYVYTANENKTKLLTLVNIIPSVAKQSLEQSGVFEPRFTWQPMQGAKTVLLSGPPRYLELVEQVVSAYDKLAGKTDKNAHTVKVFPLQNAWAKDRVIKTRGEEYVIPGVATSVKRILSREQSPYYLADSSGESDISNPVHGQFTQAKNGTTGVALKGEGLAGQGGGAKTEKGKESTSTASQGQLLTSPPAEGAYVEASPQQNAVIVYDLQSRMPLYESLIKSLDIPSDQVEIEVSIIDVKTSRLSELGVAWQANGEDGKAGFGQTQELFNEVNGLSALAGDRVNLSTIAAGQVDYLLGRVKALSQDGDGQILSQPTVLTMDNQEALIDNSSTFFVRLQGQEEVDLVPITTGSILKVTPRIMNNRNRISLSVDISDGERQSSQVDNIPSISTSHINTQAVVEASSSLLVGGYYYDQQSEDQDKVPVLGDIPIVKLLFSNSRKSRVKVARLFLITPRIITSDNKSGLFARSQQLYDMVEREKSFYDTQYSEPQLSIFD